MVQGSLDIARSEAVQFGCGYLGSWMHLCLTYLEKAYVLRRQ